MMQQGLVTVVIPNYNYAHYLRACVDSVLAQTHPDIEIIVVDDGSKDTSKEVLDSYGDKITAVFQQNQGVSAARNNGAQKGTGEFIAFLDADDVWLPEKVEKQITRFVADPALGLVHVGVDEMDADGNSLLIRLEGSDGDATADMLSLGRKGVLGGGTGLMLRRRVFDEIGGFDLRLSTSADWDLSFQAASRYPVGFVHKILLRYRIHNSNMHANIRVMEHDMTIAFEKAIGDPSDPESRSLYGNLFKTLAGSYFRAGNYPAFVRTAWRSIRYEPANLAYFFKYPLRRFTAE